MSKYCGLFRRIGRRRFLKRIWETMDLEFIKRKNNRLEDFDYSDPNNIYYITICSHNKNKYFIDNKINKIILDEIDFRTIEEIDLYCYCLMPDHLHLLIKLKESYKKGLANWISAYKRYTTRIVNFYFGIKPLWQRNFYDHVVRKEESLKAIAEYIINNPARKDIVSYWEDYPYSKIVDDLPI